MSETLHPPAFPNLLPLLRQSLAQEGHFVLPLNGTSMRPTLPVACRVEIVPLPDDAEQLPLGSLIVFAVGDVLITHRLVARRMVGGEGVWIAQGDGRRGADAPIPPDQVLGQVVRAVDASGQVLWPRAGERGWAGFWILRHHMLGAARSLVRRLRGRSKIAKQHKMF